MKEILVEMIDVSKVYGEFSCEFRALSHVSLSVSKGEFIGITGESGSGKSTLLNIMGVLDVPTSGTIRYNGEDLRKYPYDRIAQFRLKKMGFVFQQYRLERNFTVAQNVELPLVIAGIKKAERRQEVMRVLEEVKLSDKIDCIARTLSGGEKQRVSLARAMIGRPELLLADEPTGNLDSSNGAHIIDLLHRLNQADGVTVVLVTHNGDDLRYCDRIVRLKDGVLL